MKSILSVILVLAAAAVADAQCVGGACGAQRLSHPIFNRGTQSIFVGRNTFQRAPQTYYRVIPRQSYRVVVPRQTYRFMSPVRSVSCVNCH